jgi:glycosyl transferase, family 25
MAPLIHVINLARDVERMASIRANLEARGLVFERLPAVMGKDVPEREKLVDLPAYAWRNRLDAPRAGEVGCYLSHFKAMEAFLRTDARGA